MLLAQLSVTLLALFGHFAWWIAVFNRLHATGLPRWAFRLRRPRRSRKDKQLPLPE